MDMNDTSLNDKPVASSAPASFPPFFRRRTLGRAPSPPTWACYEQIPPQASDSDEDEVQTASDSESGSDSEGEDNGNVNDSSNNNTNGWQRRTRADSLCEDMEMDMDMGEPDRTSAVSGSKMAVGGDGERNEEGDEAKNACGSLSEQCHSDGCEDEQQRVKRVDKGKQRAVDPTPATDEKEKSPKRPHRRRKHHEPPCVYRPILTIKKSEGFVWNQDLFVPSYIKDRYVASISRSSVEFSSSTSPVPASDFNDNYEIEVVEIRVQGNELDGILS